MSAPNPTPHPVGTLQCCICGQRLTRMYDAEPIRERGVRLAVVRCRDYGGCMVRAARARRIEIGAEEE